MITRLMGVPHTKHGFPSLSVNAMFQLEESFAAFGVDVIADRRPAEFDRLAQDLLQSLMKLPQFGPGQRRGATARPNLGAEQRLIGIDVADAAQQLLIEQRALDRSFASVEERDEMVEVDVQRLDARRSETCSLLGVDAHDRQSAEPTHIDKAQLASGFSFSTACVCFSISASGDAISNCPVMPRCTIH